jgi:dihydroorotase
MKYHLRNCKVVNEGEIYEAELIISDGIIAGVRKISDEKLFNAELFQNAEQIDLKGNYLFPGIIDDQVHFREPGLTHKGDIHSESAAAAAGGITSFMEMPNTVPNAVSLNLLEQKYDLAQEKSYTNYSFFLGASNSNIEELLKADPAKICGIKLFMGSSTGNMLVDRKESLEQIFSLKHMLIALHCEDEDIITNNISRFKKMYGEDIPYRYHPLIRSAEACYRSSSYAAELAAKFGARIHILHISTEKELNLFRNDIPLEQKQITSEVCVHHLWFSDKDYEAKQQYIKWNPSIKTEQDRQALFTAMLDDRIDIVATDHAPHTIEEKSKGYFKAPSGGPLVQHSLPVMLEFFHQGKISLEQIADKMCHKPARLFRIEQRGFIREGYKADLCVVDLNAHWTVSDENIRYKCGWSPFDGYRFKSSVTHTFVNGSLIYENGHLHPIHAGERLTFKVL